MKHFLLNHLLVLTIVLLAGSAYGQVTAKASATATVVAPISLSKVTDMNFGNVAVSSSGSGSVILTTADTRSTSGTGVTLPATSGTVSAAAFTVAGAPGFTYSITLPGSCNLSDGSGHSMTIGSFVSSPATSGTLSTSGTQNLKVSATLAVSAAQPAGTYVNSTGVPVTVNYN